MINRDGFMSGYAEFTVQNYLLLLLTCKVTEIKKSYFLGPIGTVVVLILG